MLQGAGSLLGAVVAFVAELQPLRPDRLVRASASLWPLPAAANAWQAWNKYTSSHVSSPLVESSMAHVTIPGFGEEPNGITILIFVGDESDQVL